MTRSFATIFVDWLSWDSKLPNTGIPSDDFRDKLGKPFRARAPLLVQEGWREAPGWSLTDDRPDSMPTVFL